MTRSMVLLRMVRDDTRPLLDIGINLPRLARMLRLCPALFGLWFARRQERRVLSDLDDRMLRDIGITREQARSEAAKPGWHR